MPFTPDFLGATTGRKDKYRCNQSACCEMTSMSSEELRLRLERASRMGTVSWVFSCRSELQRAERDLKLRVNYTECCFSHGTECTHFSSLAMSLCWESSSISGRLVMMSRWTSTGATDTSSMSLVANSCSNDKGEGLWLLTVENTVSNTQWLMFKTTLGSTTLSSHLNWFMMMRGTLRAPSPALWESAKRLKC